MKLLRILRLAGRLLFGFALVIGFKAYCMISSDGAVAVQHGTSIPKLLFVLIAILWVIFAFFWASATIASSRFGGKSDPKGSAA
jgi:hypothetical protein